MGRLLLGWFFCRPVLWATIEDIEGRRIPSFTPRRWSLLLGGGGRGREAALHDVTPFWPTTTGVPPFLYLSEGERSREKGERLGEDRKSSGRRCSSLLGR